MKARRLSSTLGTFPVRIPQFRGGFRHPAQAKSLLLIAEEGRRSQSCHSPVTTVTYRSMICLAVKAFAMGRGGGRVLTEVSRHRAAA